MKKVLIVTTLTFNRGSVSPATITTLVKCTSINEEIAIKRRLESNPPALIEILQNNIPAYELQQKAETMERIEQIVKKCTVLIAEFFSLQELETPIVISTKMYNPN